MSGVAEFANAVGSRNFQNIQFKNNWSFSHCPQEVDHCWFGPSKNITMFSWCEYVACKLFEVCKIVPDYIVWQHDNQAHY